MSLAWAVGITTTAERLDDLLPRTMQSLEAAGFTRPRLFVDGADSSLPWWYFNADVTVRPEPRVGNYVNWYLGAAELLGRNPDADRFLMLEDDIVLCRGLREYLEAVPMPAKGYCNLYVGGDGNHMLAEGKRGWFRSDNRGLGALALMFDRATLVQLLGSESFVRHRFEKKRGGYNVDGAIVAALRSNSVCVIEEYCHNPSLVQHTGSERSTLGHSSPAVTELFPGEEFDARSLI